MPRALILCTTIVAAFPLHLAAAAANFEDAPLSPAAVEVATQLGLDPARDRARLIPELTQMLYTAALNRRGLIEMLRDARRDAAPTQPPILVPVPMSERIWSSAVFRRAVPRAQLVTAILTDRRAALVCRGLAGLDEDTLAYLASHTEIITYLYEHAAAAFGAFGDSLKIRDGQIVPAGGGAAVALWESVTREKVTAPERFIEVLFGAFAGRLAYLHSAIAAANGPAAAFALGMWMEDATIREKRFGALVQAVIAGYHDWRIDERPFARPLGDLSLLLLRLRAEPSGAPAEPSRLAFWAEALDAPADPTGMPSARDAPADAAIDAAWFVNATGGDSMYERMGRLDQFAFAQRVFAAADAAGSPAAVAVVKAFPRYPMLMLTLERMNIRTPAVYAAALQQAASASAADSDRRFWTLAQLQGALMLVAGLRRAGTITPVASEALVVSLSAVPLGRDGSFAGGIAQWIRTDLAKALPPGATVDERVVAGLAGPGGESGTASLIWEGEPYRLDPAFAERRRLEIVRAKQGGHTLTLGVEIDAIGRRLRAPDVSAPVVARAVADIGDLLTTRAGELQRAPVALTPPGVTPPRDAIEWLTKSADELNRIVRSNDPRRAGRIGASIQELADVVLGNALLSLTYAANIGDPDGAALLGANVALRHDFGFARKDSGRLKTPWAVPRQDFQPGVPWHISGSALGLDIALAQLGLRRLRIDGIAEEPRLPSIERDALAVGVTLMDATRLTDRDRDQIAAAIARGRERMQRLAAGTETVDSVGDALMLDGWRRRTLSWAVQNEPQLIAAEFSLGELLVLGGGAPGADLDAWGTSALQSDGCACTQFPKANAGRVLGGRPQLATLAAAIDDFALEVAVVLSELKLPAPLARPILLLGMQDFIDQSNTADANDWRSLARQAQSIPRQRIEDYIAAAAAIDGPLVPLETGSSGVP